MEAALAVAALVVVLVLCAAGLGAIGTQVRCIDAARLAARGDDAAAAMALRSVAPAGAVLQMRRDGDFVVATVSAGTLLPGLSVRAAAVAAVERPG